MPNSLVFPPSLGSPLLSSGTGEINLGLKVSRMEGGNVRTYQKFANMPGIFTATFMLTALKVARLQSFVKQAAGASFDMDVLMPGDPDNGITTRSCQIIGNLSYEGKRSDLFMYSFPVRVDEAPNSDDTDWAYFDWADGNFDAVLQAMEDATESIPLV